MLATLAAHPFEDPFGVAVVEFVAIEREVDVVVGESREEVEMCVFDLADESAGRVEDAEPVGVERPVHRGRDGLCSLDDGRRRRRFGQQQVLDVDVRDDEYVCLGRRVGVEKRGRLRVVVEHVSVPVAVHDPTEQTVGRVRVDVRVRVHARASGAGHIALAPAAGFATRSSRRAGRDGTHQARCFFTRPGVLAGMSRRILVPVDGSPKSTKGLEYAVSTYGEEEITVLHVMSPHDVWDEADEDASDGDEDVPDEWRERARERADEILADARETAGVHDVSVSTAVEVGEPWRTIVDYAGEEGFDHVIMGSHGRHDDSPLPLGSVAETVMRRSPVLVSIVR